MSMAEPSKGFGSPPAQPPPTDYPNAPEGGELGRFPPPSLPPMSSLLRHETAGQVQQRNLARQFLPPYNMTKMAMPHPLALSQNDPDAPVRHIYHPPQQPLDSQISQMHVDPLLVPQQHDFAVPQGAVPGRGQQRRQIKKISQRRADLLKDRGSEVRKSPVMRVRPGDQSRFHPPQPTQDLNTYSRRDSSHSEASSSSRRMSSQTQNSRPMPISDLLSASPNPQPPQRPPPTYSIRMRQEPQSARACGFGERDRRVIDPPPILQMHVTDANATSEELSQLMKQPFAVVHCTLWDPVNNTDATKMPGATDKRQQRRLMGTLVSSPFVGKDEYDVEGCFFPFPDLSVRTPGVYCLKFSLVVLDPTQMRQGNRVDVQSTVNSQSFEVHTAKEFGGMQASSELTKRLKHQGCLISVKKGNGRTDDSRKADRDDEEEEEEEEDLEEGDDGERISSTRRGKRLKR